MYSAILVDEKILAQNSIPPKNFSAMTVKIVPVKIAQKLSSFPLGKKRVEYISTEEFTSSVVYSGNIFYSTKKNLVILPTDCYPYITEILQATFSGQLPPDVLLWIDIQISSPQFSQTVDKLVHNGFSHPVLVTENPAKEKIDLSLSVNRTNSASSISYNSVMNQITHVLDHKNKDKDSPCTLTAKITPRALKFLRKTTKQGITVNKNGKKSQKELTGELYVKKVDQENGQIVYKIDVDKGSVQSGEEENVDVSATRYNFHSHPQEAYLKYSVDKAWPSQTDYLGYLKLGNSTIFHCVATLEGLYVMSFSPYWCKRLKKVSSSFVANNFHVDHNEPITPKEYIEKINSILYKGHPIYQVKFFTWEEAKQPFQVYYSDVKNTCISSQKEIDRYREIYG